MDALEVIRSTTSHATQWGEGEHESEVWLLAGDTSTILVIVITNTDLGSEASQE